MLRTSRWLRFLGVCAAARKFIVVWPHKGALSCINIHVYHNIAAFIQVMPLGLFFLDEGLQRL